jgi:hypothetical protein
MTRRFRNVGVRCSIGSPAYWFHRLCEPMGQWGNLTLLFQEIRQLPVRSVLGFNSTKKANQQLAQRAWR